MKARPDVKSGVHCHPPHATAFAIAREPIPQCVLPEVEVFLGDDVTDEDAFTELRDRGVGIVVGDDDRPTAAHFRLADTAAVLDLLVRIADGIEDSRRVTGAQTPPRLDADGRPTG